MQSGNNCPIIHKYASGDSNARIDEGEIELSKRPLNLCNTLMHVYVHGSAEGLHLLDKTVKSEY
jgi:hypothetical protein